VVMFAHVHLLSDTELYTMGMFNVTYFAKIK
jgi:hypothetical protein